MAKYVTVSARIPEETKENIDKYNIQTTDVIRKALEEEIKRKKTEEIKKKLDSVSEELAKIDQNVTEKLIREERDKR